MNMYDYLNTLEGVVPDEHMKNRMYANVTAASRKKGFKLGSALVTMVVLAVLTITAGAVYAAINWNHLFITYYTPTEEQIQMLSGSMFEVNQSVEKDGFTYTVTQVMGDEHSLCAAVEVKFPDEFDLSRFYTEVEQLREVAEGNGHNWDEVLEWLVDVYNYDGVSDAIWSNIGREMFGEPEIHPVTMTEEELYAKLATYPESTQEMLLQEHILSMVLFTYNSEENSNPQQSSFNSSSRILMRDFNYETRTLYLLVVSSHSVSPANKGCTLLMQGLVAVDLMELMADCTDLNWMLTDKDIALTDELVIINFDADYEPYSNTYAIYSDEEQVGTIDLSPFSAWVEISGMITDEPFEFDINIHLMDGSVILLKKSAGSPTMAIQYAETLFALDQVAYIEISGYTIELVEG